MNLWEKILSKVFRTEVIKKCAHNHARVTRMHTAHGEITTPAFMPVGTRAVVNHMTPQDLETAGSQIILGGNTYHMLTSPGLNTIELAGGMHRFMAWDKPMLTDSGGFQVFSLSKNGKICKIDEKGGHFKHPQTGQVIHLTPSTSIQAQRIIGADIVMAFDQCTPEQGGREIAVAAMQRTHRWLLESKEEFSRHAQTSYGYTQALFGIIQGGSFEDLRLESAEFVVNLDLDGIAIGGEVIGFDMQKTAEVLNWVRPLIPENKTRYTMGVGLLPQDLIDVVAQGIDIFDCVAPTRNARHGALYCGHMQRTDNWFTYTSEEDRGRLLIKKSIYANDNRPIIDDCTCYTCQNFTRAYLHFLFKQGAAAYAHLACIHNIHVMHHVCETMREFILSS